MLVCESNSRQAKRTKKKKNERKSNIHVNELTNAGNIDAERKKNCLFAAHELHSRTRTAIADIRQCKKK